MTSSTLGVELLLQMKPSKYEPDCVIRAREMADPMALKVVLSWLKKKGASESQRLELAKVFCAVHNLTLDAVQLFDVLNTPVFTCDFARELGFCDEENCRFRLPPAERLILDTESVLIFHSSRELDLKIAGKRKIIPLKKFFKRVKGETVIKYQREKIAKSIQRLLVGSSKRLRVGKERHYFWRFNLKAIQTILGERAMIGNLRF